MSDTVNPYQPPVSPDEPAGPTEGLGDISELTRQHLGKASPWLSFLGVMSYIGCGLTVVFGLVMMFSAIFGGNIFGSAGQSRATASALGLVYLVFGIVLYFPARFVFRMGSNAKRYTQGADANALEGVALNLRKVSKFYGVVTVVVVGLIVLGLLTALIVAIAGGTKG